MEKEEKKEEVKKEEPEFSFSDRGRIYDSYEKLGSMGGEPVVEPPAKEPEKEVKKEDTAEAPVEASAEPEAEKKPAQEPVVEKPKKEDHQPTVPLDALHKEREKRKEAQAKVKELESQLSTVLKDLKELTEKQKSVEGESISDYETEIRNLKKEIVGLRSELSSYRKETDTRETQRQMATVKQNLERTAQELKDAGFPLFIEMQHLVVDEILKKVNEDPDNRDDIIREFDNPDGWKRIYKETVFPRINSFFVPKNKEAEKNDKIEAKKEARLSGGPGAKVEPDKKEDSWSYEDYLKERKGRALSGREL